ncbi:MAG: hypothetical protein MJ152_01475, partial [Clostridia bacterium]|nr:hypothetical protein [Clostridia bacterium]
MKTLKKYLKVILCFMAFALASFAFAFSPISPVYAASTSIAMLSTKNKIPTKVDAQTEDLRIPLLKSMTLDATNGYEIRVKDSSTQWHVYQGVEDGYFTADGDYVKIAKEKLVGSNDTSYEIVYVTNNGLDADGQVVHYYYSKVYTVKVTDASYTLKLVEEDNTHIYIPSKIATDANARVELPTRAEKNGVECTSDVTVEISKAGHIVASYTLGTSPVGNEYVVDGKFVPKEAGEYVIKYSANKCEDERVSFEVEDDYVKPSKEEIKIESINVPNTNNVIELGKKNIPLVSNPQAENPIKVTYDGKDVKYNVTKVTITNVDNPTIKQVLPANTFVFDMTTDKFEGVTSYKNLAGKYKFEFEIVDVYGNTFNVFANLDKEGKVVSMSATDVKPTIHMAYNYSVDADTKEVVGEVNTRVDADLKTSVGYKEVVLPAIYAEDNVATNAEIKYFRYLTQTSTGKKFYVDNIIVDNYKVYKLEYKLGADDKYHFVKEGTTDEYYDGNFALVTKNGGEGYTTSYGNANSSVAVQFAEYDADGHYSTEDISLYCGEDNGKYAIHYEAYKDVVVSRYGELTSKTIKVETSEKHSGEVSTPVVNITNLSNESSVAQNSTIKVKTHCSDADVEDVLKTSVFYKNYATSDEIDIDSIKTSATTALATAITTYYEDELLKNYGTCNVLDTDAFKTAFGFEKANNNLDADGEYEVTFSEDTGYYAVVAITINKDNQLGISVRKLRIKNLNDSDAPTADDNSWDNTKQVAQQTVVDLPEVTFTDSDKSLALAVGYYVENPENKDSIPQFEDVKSVNYGDKTIKGVTLNADKVGKYYVVYTATDDAGNTTNVYYTFEVKATPDPVLDVSAAGEDLTIAGNEIKGEFKKDGLEVKFNVEMIFAETDDSAEVVASEIKCDIESNGVRYDKGNDQYSYILKSPGTIQVTFSGWVEYAIGGKRQAISKTFTVKANLPEMKWLNENKLTELETVAEQNMPIQLPVLEANQSGDVNVKIEYIYNGTTKDVTDTAVWDKSTHTFTPDKSDGRYVVTYTAISEYGATIKASHTFKLGDTYKPTFVVTGDSDLRKDISLVANGKISYKVSYTRWDKPFTVTIDGKEYSLNVKVNDAGKSGVPQEYLWYRSDLTATLLKDG